MRVDTPDLLSMQVTRLTSGDEPVVETQDGFIYLNGRGEARFCDLSPDRDSPLPTEAEFRWARHLLHLPSSMATRPSASTASATRRRQPAAKPSPLLEQAAMLAAPEPEPEPIEPGPAPAPAPAVTSDGLLLSVLTQLLRRLESSPLGWGVGGRKTFYLGQPSKGSGGPIYRWDATAGEAAPAPSASFTGRLVGIQVDEREHETFGSRSKLLLDFDLGAELIRLQVGLDTAAAGALLRGLTAAAVFNRLAGPLTVVTRFGDHDSGKVVLVSIYSQGEWMNPENAAAVGADGEAPDNLAMVEVIGAVLRGEPVPAPF